MILLTGVTGTTGSLLLNALKNKNVAMRAMLRDPDKLKDADIPGLEIVQGDYEDEASLEKAMQGVDRAFMLMPNIEQQLVNEKRFVDVARRVGVGHLVKLSASKADANSPAKLKSYHGQAEEYMAESGLTYTSVRPNFYMQNMLHSIPTIAADNKFFLPMRDGGVGLIDVEDVAEFLAHVLTEDGHENKIHFITGSEVLSFSDIAQQMSDALGREISYIDIPAEDFSAQLRQFGTDEWYVDAVKDLFELIASGDGASTTDTFAEVCGRAPVTFRQFMEKHKAAFSAS